MTKIRAAGGGIENAPRGIANLLKLDPTTRVTQGAGLALGALMSFAGTAAADAAGLKDRTAEHDAVSGSVAGVGQDAIMAVASQLLQKTTLGTSLIRGAAAGPMGLLSGGAGAVAGGAAQRAIEEAMLKGGADLLATSVVSQGAGGAIGGLTSAVTTTAVVAAADAVGFTVAGSTLGEIAGVAALGGPVGIVAGAVLGATIGIIAGVVGGIQAENNRPTEREAVHAADDAWRKSNEALLKPELLAHMTHTQLDQYVNSLQATRTNTIRDSRARRDGDVRSAYDTVVDMRNNAILDEFLTDPVHHFIPEATFNRLWDAEVRQTGGMSEAQRQWREKWGSDRSWLRAITSGPTAAKGSTVLNSIGADAIFQELVDKQNVRGQNLRIREIFNARKDSNSAFGEAVYYGVKEVPQFDASGNLVYMTWEEAQAYQIP